MTNLWELDSKNNKISELKQLYALTGLDKLDYDNNPFTQASVGWVNCSHPQRRRNPPF